ncbi:hypothetical protein MMC26_002939 [Xylographa opegraphella]|nr:hypothetical protein [Xylographa opegraphella]
MHPAIQRHHHHPALDHILDTLDAFPPGYPTLSPSTIPTSSTQPAAISGTHHKPLTPEAAKCVPHARSTPRSRPQPSSTIPSRGAAYASSTSRLSDKKLHLNASRAHALPFGPNARYTALAAEYPPLWPQERSTTPSQSRPSAPAVSSADDNDAHPPCGRQKSPNAAKPAPSTIAPAFIAARPPSTESAAADPSRRCDSPAGGSDLLPTELAPLFEALGYLAVGDGEGEELMPELWATVRFARRQSWGLEERELWRWALGEEEWVRWGGMLGEDGGDSLVC